ncbi:MAG: UDP-N-acetylglucosamine 1-carboxyvinyltransferase [Actinobacteria bacterium]|nr:UDP-N-acetylglucosamine 1-carboxyvinyltransferase [Actinomycetota bacterium]
MEALQITGGIPLNGSIGVLGAKNAVLKHLVATLLAPGTHVLSNVPDIVDVRLMCEVLEHVGARCVADGTTRTVTVPEVLSAEAPLDVVRKMRASILVLGALLTRVGSVRIALPGGDDFGTRPIDMHLDGLARLGAEFESRDGVLYGEAPRGLIGADVDLGFPSVGATENILLAAVMAKGTTVLTNAAREPELEDLASYLTAMGAKVVGAGTSRIEIHGVPELVAATYSVVPDRLEAGTYLLAGAASRGEVTVVNCVPDHLRMELSKMRAAGCDVTIGESTITVSGPERPTAVDFATLPYPGFHTDMHPQMVAFLASGDGTSIMTENLYSGRFRYIEMLNRMGAAIRTDGQHVVIDGQSTLVGATVDACDIRAGAAMVIAALAAAGTTTIVDASHLDRGYTDLEPKLKSLGATIARIAL